MINKKITAILGATTILLSAVTAPVFAGSFGIGISGKAAFVEIEGKETVKTNAEVHKARHDTAAAIPSALGVLTFLLFITRKNLFS